MAVMLQSNMCNHYTEGHVFADHRFTYGCRHVGSLSLTISKNFIFFRPLFICRNLSKPIAVQYKEKEDRYVDTYKVGFVFPHILIHENSSFILQTWVLPNLKFIILTFVFFTFLCFEWQTTGNHYMILGIVVYLSSLKTLPRKRNTLVVA